MRTILAVLIVAFALLGCASVDFQPYEGKGANREGEGGTKVVVDGIDIWSTGNPPRKFSILGIVTSEIGTGIGDEAMIRSAVAAEVKKRGGSAAILIDERTASTGVYRVAPGVYSDTGKKKMRFFVVSYTN